MSPIDLRKTPAAAPVAAPARIAPGAAPEAEPASRRPETGTGVRVELSSPAPQQTAPVDHERVAEIRSALRDGTYPIVPAQIADALIAARLALRGEA